MARNDYVGTDGTINLDKIFNNIDGNTSSLADMPIQLGDVLNIKHPPVPFAIPHSCLETGYETFDNSVILQAIFNLGKTVFIPDGNFRCNNLNINLCKNIVGNGSSSILTNNSVDKSIFTNLSSTTNIFGLEFDGLSIGGTSQHGIDMGTSFNNKITNCTFTYLKGSAIKTNGVTGVSGSLIANCMFKNNGIGFFSDNLGEYTTVDNCHFYNNTIGVKIMGGNITINCCNIVLNATGILLLGGVGTNDSHGIISNCVINHNTINGLDIQGILNGETISNCHIYQNPISILNTDVKAVRFNNCCIDVDSWSVVNCKLVLFKGCYFVGDYLNTLTTSNSTMFNSNATFANARDNILFNKLPSPYLIMSNATNKSLTANTDNIIKPELGYACTSWNINNTRETFYDIATGHFIVSGFNDNTGLVTVRANFKLTKLSGDTAIGWIAKVCIVAGSTVMGYLPIIQLDTTTLLVSGCITFAVDAPGHFYIDIIPPVGVTASLSNANFALDVIGL